MKHGVRALRASGCVFLGTGRGASGKHPGSHGSEGVKGNPALMALQGCAMGREPFSLLSRKKIANQSRSTGSPVLHEWHYLSFTCVLGVNVSPEVMQLTRLTHQWVSELPALVSYPSCGHDSLPLEVVACCQSIFVTPV